MADQTRVQLTPIDTEKGYPPWGRVREVATLTTPEQIGWTTLRQGDSVRFRETHGGFKIGVMYEIEINVPSFPEPFKSRALGEQLNLGNQNVERQANYPFALIGQLPVYFELVPAP